MEITNTNLKEQIVRKVSAIGNGAHIFAPKEWINEKVLIVRIEKKELKESVIEAVYPYLDQIIAVFLYGSYARNEAGENSDIDILIIGKEKFKLEKRDCFDFVVIPENFLASAIETNPIMMYSIFKEAKPLINSKYLENLRELKVDRRLFKPFIKTTFDSIISDEEIIELDKKTGKTASNSLIYSLILRLRGIFIIKKLLKKEQYSNRLFEKWIIKDCKVNYKKIYSAYTAVRNGEKIKEEVPLEEAEILLKFLKEKIKELNKTIR